MEHEVSDRNEWFKDVKRLIRGLEVETVEDPFACPTVKNVTDGEDVLHALGLHPSRDVCGIVNVDIDEVYGLIRHIEPEPVTGSTSDGNTFDELYHHRAVLFSVIVAMFRGRSWKSLHHHDGTMYDGMFIVGIDTPPAPPPTTTTSSRTGTCSRARCSTARPSGTATRQTTPSSASAPCGTSCRRRPRRRGARNE